MKKRYQSPRVRVLLMLEMESQIQNTSVDQNSASKVRGLVDPFVEDYYGKDGYDDYLIKMN